MSAWQDDPWGQESIVSLKVQTCKGALRGVGVSGSSSLHFLPEFILGWYFSKTLPFINGNHSQCFTHASSVYLLLRICA